MDRSVNSKRLKYSLMVVMGAATVAAGARAATADPNSRLGALITTAAPSTDFVVETSPNSPLASGTVEVTAGARSISDPVTGVSFSFETTGFQRYWVNRRTGELRGIQAFPLPKKVKAEQFLNDWSESAQLFGGTITPARVTADSVAATLVVSRQPMHEIAFVSKNVGYVVVTGRSAPQATLELAQAQARFLAEPTVLGVSITAATKPLAATPTAARIMAPHGRASVFVQTWLLLGALGLFVVAGLTTLERLGLATPIVNTAKASARQQLG